ncbi:MAG: Ig-like domain-containing protein, partial [Nevskiales bacterium]|nr:Ig-like domain-containing protein [Nevskiales bacterium]
MSHSSRKASYLGILASLWLAATSVYAAPREIDPELTDPTIDPVNGNIGNLPPYSHVVYPPAAPSAGTLYVFLPGTGGTPAVFRYAYEAAASTGLHVIGLVYPNDLSINHDLCVNSQAPPGLSLAELNKWLDDCKENVRVETITGQDATPSVDVDRANSIENRLIKLLEYLDQQYPSEEWDIYLTGGQPKWDRIVVAGHSQGGGHAAMIGKLYRVVRVNLFASTEPAAWTTETLATPASSYFGFVHTLDPEYSAFVNSWNNLQIPGPLKSIDGALPPYGSSHQLQSSAPSHWPNYHAAVVSDYGTPLVDGVPLYRDVWIYMMTGGSDITPPATPTSLSATAAATTRINLSWTASSDNVGVTGYRVERCQGSGCTGFAQIASPTGTSHSDTGLAVNTTYRYRVRAVDAAGNGSAYSAIASATTLSPDLFPPTVSITAPVNGATVSGVVTVTAQASDNVGIASVAFAVDGTTLDADTNAPYSFLWDTADTSNGAHTLTATASDTAGNTMISSPVNVTVNNAHGLVGHWKFDEGSGTTASDSSGNGNTGTLNGPVWVPGAIGRALSFDGINDYVSIPGFNATLLPATLTAWIKADALGSCDAVVFSRSTDVSGLNAG